MIVSRTLRRLLRTARAFAHERKGQVALTFAFAFIPALLMTGAAIDYSRSVAQRSNLQQATDSTVLAMAHTYLTPASTNTTLFQPTQTYLTGVMGSVAPSSFVVTANNISGTPNAATLQTITLSQNNTVMCITTTDIVPTTILTIASIKYVGVAAQACSQVGGTYEVALVLDNSYSMIESLGNGDKMQALQSAATSLINILIPSGTVTPTTAISIVPFNALVNVGTSRAAPFLDTTGQSSLNWKDILQPAGTTPPSRFTLFDNLYTSSSKTATVPWAGCVEERPNNLYNYNVNVSQASQNKNYLTTDLAASSSNGPDSFFVPYFSPDDPGPVSTTPNSYYGYFTDYTNTYYDCNNYSSYAYPYACSSDTKSYTFPNGYLGVNGYRNANNAPSCNSTSWAIDQGFYGNPYNGNPIVYPGSGATLACKYNKAVATINPNQWFGLSIGPNSNCSTPAITPLTTNTTTLLNAVSAMQPTGLTNLGTGFMWGWRTISPVVNPYPIANPTTIGQQNPKTYNYGPPSNTKVIVLMTDGYNTWSPIIFTPANGAFGGINTPFLSAYETYGYMTDNRLANYSTTCPTTSANTSPGNVTNQSNFRCQMDNVVVEACTNAKNAGIVIYTVGFSIASDPIDQEGFNVLQACATSSSTFFVASTSASIVAAFQQIAASITNLRISH